MPEYVSHKLHGALRLRGLENCPMHAQELARLGARSRLQGRPGARRRRLARSADPGHRPARLRVAHHRRASGPRRPPHEFPAGPSRQPKNARWMAVLGGRSERVSAVNQQMSAEQDELLRAHARASEELKGTSATVRVSTMRSRAARFYLPCKPISESGMPAMAICRSLKAKPRSLLRGYEQSPQQFRQLEKPLRSCAASSKGS
jgi:hypothetical protein